MSKSCAVTLILILSLTATIYPHQASLKLKAEGVLARLEKLGDSVTVTICHNKDGNVREFAHLREAGHEQSTNNLPGDEGGPGCHNPAESKGRVDSFRWWAATSYGLL